ncbi:GumC family protein [Spirosoma arcticum]
MNAQLLFRLLRQNSLWLLLIPALTAATAFYFTRNQIRTYQSSAVLYTGLASGYSILSDDKNARVDHNAVTNAFENLLSTVTSRQTIAEVGLRLLSRHLLLNRPDSLVLGSQGFAQLQRAIPADLRRSLTVDRNEQAVYQRVEALAQAAGANPVKTLLNNPASWYGPAKIKKGLKAVRKKDSDMLELSYESEDAAITHTTLTELIAVFSNRYASLKSSETNPVVRYYNDANRKATRKLQQAEMRIKAFEEDNKIINYDEESRAIAVEKEDILNQYNEELMKSRAAKASMETLGKRLEDRMTVLKTNDELIAKRTELTTATNQLAQAQVRGRSRENIEQLSAKAARLSDELKTAAQKYYKTGNSVESLPQTRLLDEWLNKLVQYEESAARLNVYEDRLEKFNEMAARFAPLGTTLSQLKRDVSVAEKDYLANLTALNQAQTRQKNAEMTGPLRLLDAPEFPQQPLPSKRGLLIGGALGVGLVLALLLLLIRYLADGRLYSPARFTTVTGLPVAASFPTVPRRMRGLRARAVAQYMLEQLRSTAAIDSTPVPTYRPYELITVWSTRPRQGKTWLANQLAERYGLAGKRVAYLHPHPTGNALTLPEEVTSIGYAIRSDFAYTKRVDELVDDRFSPEDYDIVLLELPDLGETPIATHLVAQSNLLLLITSAKITWKPQDQNLYQLYRKATNAPILPVLNHVSTGLIEVSQPVSHPSPVAVTAPNAASTVSTTRETV